DLQPSASQSKPLTVAPVSAGPLTDTLAIAFDTAAVHCKAPPTSATITATGTTSVGISASTLDFGQVNCGTTGTEQGVVISSSIAMTFTAVLTKGGLSPYTLADATNAPVAGVNPIQLAAASSYTLNVVPKQIPPVSATDADAFDDILTVTTSD